MGHAHCVLLIDDDVQSSEALLALLHMSGTAVVHAPNGRRALDILSEKRDFCLILLDLLMPVMDGYAFREAQRADPMLSTIPVVVLSGVYEYAAAQLGLTVFLKKPFPPADLLVAIDRNCARSR
jgi:CheY-like chemotaxis protein